MSDSIRRSNRPRKIPRGLAGAIIFDLDDTLYPERDFAVSGFKQASSVFADRKGVTGLEAICIDLFDAGKRDRIFDRALSRMGVELSAGLIDTLVETYRFHRPEIRLGEDAERFLLTAPSKIGLGIITDGMGRTQRAKIDALGLSRFMHHVICTDEWGREYWKPHPRAFVEMERHFNLDASRMVYVGDNPAKDFVTPRDRGWLTVQICRPDRVHTAGPPTPHHAAHKSIPILDELAGIAASRIDFTQATEKRPGKSNDAGRS